MPRRIRRLTRLELQNTLTDVLGEEAGALAQTLEADTTTTGFSTGADRGISAAYVSGLYRLARLGTSQLGDEILGVGESCATDEESARGCAKDVIRELGARLWRRSLGDDEQTGLLAVYGAGQRTAVPDFALAARHRAGVEYVVRALVQSPSFLYRTELGADTGAIPATPVSLTAREAASAVSYGLLASPPDDELVAWAAGGGAPTEDELLRQARRLLTAYPERFAAQAERFVREWLSIDLSSPVWAKDPVLYPLATPELKSALDRETALFLRGWAAAPSLTELLTAPLGYVSRKNAWIYGVPDDSPLFFDGGPEFTALALPPSVRAGVLTLPSVLGSWAKTGSSSPVKRGVAVMRNLLCREPPPVPAQVPPLPPADQAAASTTRARYEQHTSAPACASCHRAIDPMGFSFERYDAMGVYRETENGVAVDSRGALVDGEQSVEVPDAIALAQLLARSGSVHACMVRQVYRFTSGQREGNDEGCALESRTKQFQDAGLDVADLMVRLVASEAASRRAEGQP